MKSLLRNYYHNSTIGFYIINPWVKVYHFFLFKKFLSDEEFLKKKFRKCHGVELDLNNPESLNEKINWLKLNLKTPLIDKIADKYAVREYVKEKIEKNT